MIQEKPAAHWDQILQQESTADSHSRTESFRKALPLTSNNRRLLPRRHRRLDQVEPRLCEVFRKLATGEENWPLFIFGEPGVGKTCAALALCDVIETAAYLTTEELCDRTMAQPAGEVQEMWETIGQKHLAVLDEIGCRERVTHLHYSTTKRFLDVRELEASRVGIYISNVQPDDIGRLYDRRIASRMLAGVCFHLKDRDRRYAK